MPVKLWAKGKKDRTTKQILDDQVEAIARLRAADKKAVAASKKPNWVSKLKDKVGKLTKSRHSKAGKEYLAKKG